MQVVLISSPGEMSIRETNIPRPGADELLVRIRASGICGTDVHIYHGGFFAEYPLVPGHEFSGDVVSCGEACTRFEKGDRVAVEPNIPCNNCPECLRGAHHYCQNMIIPGVNRPGGLAEYVLVKERAAFSLDALSYVQGALVEPLSCVVHAVERLSPRMCDRLLVMGAGPIGLMLGRVARAAGVGQVDYLERSEERRQYVASAACGQVFATTDDIPDKRYECVIDATGVSGLVAEAANRLARVRGKVLVFGVPKTGSRIEVDHFRMYRDEIQVIASFTSLKNSQQAIDLMAAKVVRVDDLVSHQIKLSEVPEYVMRMQSGDGTLRKVMVTDFD